MTIYIIYFRFLFSLLLNLVDIFQEPLHASEGGLGASDEVAITRDHQLPLFSVVFRNIKGLPVERHKVMFL